MCTYARNLRMKKYRLSAVFLGLQLRVLSHDRRKKEDFTSTLSSAICSSRKIEKTFCPFLSCGLSGIVHNVQKQHKDNEPRSWQLQYACASLNPIIPQTKNRKQPERNKHPLGSFSASSSENY